MSTENTELVIIENAELKAVVEANASIGLTKAQAHAVAFAPSMNKVHELSKILKQKIVNYILEQSDKL